MRVSLGAQIQREEVLQNCRRAQKYRNLSDHTSQRKRTAELAMKYLDVLVRGLRYPMQ